MFLNHFFSNILKYIRIYLSINFFLSHYLTFILKSYWLRTPLGVFFWIFLAITGGCMNQPMSPPHTPMHAHAQSPSPVLHTLPACTQLQVREPHPTHFGTWYCTPVLSVAGARGEYGLHIIPTPTLRPCTPHYPRCSHSPRLFTRAGDRRVIFTPLHPHPHHIVHAA
jgi:hypothetical protein